MQGGAPMQDSEGVALSNPGKNELAYGCIFCVTGKEKQTAESIERACTDIRTMVARQTKFKSTDGKKHIVEATLFPGYVFFVAPSQQNLRQVLLADNVLSVWV